MFALEQDEDPIVLSVNSNPKEYMEITENYYINKKHKENTAWYKGNGY